MSEKPLSDVDTSYDEKVAISNEHDEKLPTSRDAEAVGHKAVALNIVENPLQVRLFACAATKCGITPEHGTELTSLS